MILNYKHFTLGLTGIIAFTLFSFVSKPKQIEYVPISKINVVNIEIEGFELLQSIQGQWLGINSVAGMNFNWFVWDYRPISSSHIHGIYEGGSMGNLFTSFFVANFKGTKTIMARNGGVLNGIYRTSYFVLDEVKNDDNGQYYRLVDAVGGKNTMYMDLRFKNDSLYWNSYTSRLGEKSKSSRHMTYKGKKYKDNLAKATAEKLNFPKKEAAYKFPKGFDNSYLYMKKSASFLWQTNSNANVYDMAKSALDPITIMDYPHISSLKVNLERNKKIKNKQIILYVSTIPLTDEKGNLSKNVSDYNNNILFSFLNNGEEEFKFTYVHPGKYYVTAIADIDRNYIISKNDISSKSATVVITPESNVSVKIQDIVNKNKVTIFQNLGSDFYNEKNIKEDKNEEIPVIDWTVNYNNDVKKIIANNCMTCHSNPSPSARLDLSSLSELKGAIKYKGLIERINNKNNPMPPKEMLSLKERAIISKWKEDGLLKK